MRNALLELLDDKDMDFKEPENFFIDLINKLLHIIIISGVLYISIGIVFILSLLLIS